METTLRPLRCVDDHAPPSADHQIRPTFTSLSISIISYLNLLLLSQSLLILQYILSIHLPAILLELSSYQ